MLSERGAVTVVIAASHGLGGGVAGLGATVTGASRLKVPITSPGADPPSPLAG